MLKGKTLQELAAKIENIKERKKDFVAPSCKLHALPQTIDVVEGEEKKEKRVVRLGINGIEAENMFEISPFMHGQISDRLKIPRPYYNRMQSEAPDLLASNINHWFQADTRNRMVRTLKPDNGGLPVARALLSDRYRRIENELIAEAALPVLFEMGEDKGVEVFSSEITDTRMYLQVGFAAIQAEVRAGDVVRAGLAFRNSEVGSGMFAIEQFIIRLVCMNGQVRAAAMRKYHVGRRVDTGDEVIADFYSDRTIQADDKALLLKVQDTTRHAFDVDAFQNTVFQMQQAAGMQIEATKLDKVVEKVDRACRLDFTENERGSILQNLIKGGDLSKWGMVNAVTAAAHQAGSYDRAYEFEKAGTKVLDMTDGAWTEAAGK